MFEDTIAAIATAPGRAGIACVRISLLGGRKHIYGAIVGVLATYGLFDFVVETMMSLAETRAAVIAIREVCDLPVMTSMTFQEDGRTLYGTDPVTAVVVLQSIGADVIGVNCSTGHHDGDIGI